MTNNTYAKIIKTIGFIFMFGGVILSFILGGIFENEIVYKASMYSYDSYKEYNWTLAILGSISSFVSGLLLVCFGEIIDLLQASYDKQTDILNAIKSNNNYTKSNYTAVIKDIPENNIKNFLNNNTENNTPQKYNTTHTWRCSKCNNMITESPCPYCGYEY